MPNDSCIDAQPLSSADTGDHGMPSKSAEEAGNLHASREYRPCGDCKLHPEGVSRFAAMQRVSSGHQRLAPLNVTPDVVSLREAEQNKLGQRIGAIAFTGFAVVQDDASYLSMRICSGVKPR